MPRNVPTPLVHAMENPQILAQTDGTAREEPPHRVVEMTPDKTPLNAPIWYNLAINASFATIICAVFLYKQFTDPSLTDVAREAASTSEKLIDRVLVGTDKMLDKQERIQDKAKLNIDSMKTNTDEIKEIFRTRAIAADLRADRFEVSCEKVVNAFKDTVDRAEKYHNASKINHETAKALQERLLKVLEDLAPNK